MLPMGPGGPRLYCSPIPLLGPGCMNCSPASKKTTTVVSFSSDRTPTASDLLVRLSLTFPHATEGVLVGLVGTHSSNHLWAAHPGLVALRVGSHGVPSGERRVSAISKRILQINATPREGQEACS